MKAIFAALLTMIILFPATAEAGRKDMGIYVGVRGGVHSLGANLSSSNSTDDDSDKGLDGSLAVFVGYDWSNDGFDARTELEYGMYSVQSLDTNGTDADDMIFEGRVNVYALFINNYFDFENSTSLTPYVGAGIGVARITSTLDFDSDDTLFGMESPSERTHYTYNLAWNLNAGIAWELSDTVALDFQGRYVDFGSFNHSSDKDDFLWEASGDLSTYSSSLGLRVSF